jgi:Pyruvate/2-oxoacid:ferredoxin oxidoreductase gamma subunit
MIRIGIAGRGGQGIVFIGRVVGKTALKSRLYSAVTSSYGSEVRGGSVLSSVVIDEREIVNPYIDSFDYIFILDSIGWSKVNIMGDEYIVADKTLAWRDDLEGVDWREFDKYSHMHELPLNMIVAGYMARLGIIDYNALIEVIKESGRSAERNLKAIEIGYKEI